MTTVKVHATALAAVAAAAVTLAPASRVAAETIPPEIATEVTARLKALAPIIRNGEAERDRLGIPVEERDRCTAQLVLLAAAMVGGKVFEKSSLAKLPQYPLKNSPTYAYAIAKADFTDLESIVRFAGCMLPGGLTAKLNVCSTFGMVLSGKLAGDVLDPRLIDSRPLDVRCPGYKQPW